MTKLYYVSRVDISLRAKVSDFGLSQKKWADYQFSTTILSAFRCMCIWPVANLCQYRNVPVYLETSLWTAPEVLLGEPPTTKSDVVLTIHFVVVERSYQNYFTQYHDWYVQFTTLLLWSCTDLQFSFGITACEVLTRKDPYSGQVFLYPIFFNETITIRKRIWDLIP